MISEACVTLKKIRKHSKLRIWSEQRARDCECAWHSLKIAGNLIWLEITVGVDRKWRK